MSKSNIYETVTNTIISAIEQDAGQWKMPWAGANLHMPKNGITGAYYNGINIISLWASGCVKDFQSAEWGTFKQWHSIGGQVRKGEKSSQIVFYKEFEVEPENDTDNGQRRVARGYAVFNRDQVEGLPLKEEVSDETSLVERIEKVDGYVANTGAYIKHGGSCAYYSPCNDHIVVPELISFFDTEHSTATEAYYSTLLHELTHWTGSKKRLNREFGNNLYAFEELVAELGAAFLCARLGITNETRQDHAQYIQHWLKAMKEDNKAIFKAAKFAQQAVEFIETLQNQTAVA